MPRSILLYIGVSISSQERLGFKFKEFLRPDEKALRDYIHEGRCSEALTYKDNDWDEGFNGAVAIETRLAKGGTVFLFYGRFILTSECLEALLIRQHPHRRLEEAARQSRLRTRRKRKEEECENAFILMAFGVNRVLLQSK